MRGYSPCESSTTRSDLPPPSQGPKTSLGRAKGSGSLPICFKSPPILAPLSLNPNPNHRRPQPLSLYPNPNHHISASLSLNPDQSQSQKLQPELKEKKKWEKAKRERAEFECLTQEGERWENKNEFEFCVYWWCCVWLTRKFNKNWDSYYKYFFLNL